MEHRAPQPTQPVRARREVHGLSVFDETLDTRDLQYRSCYLSGVERGAPLGFTTKTMRTVFDDLSGFRATM